MITCSELLSYMLRTLCVYATRLDNVFGSDWVEPMQHLLELGVVSEYLYKNNSSYRVRMKLELPHRSQTPFAINVGRGIKQ